MGNIRITKKLRKLALDCVSYSETGNKVEKMFGLYKSVPPSGYSVGPIQFDISHNRQGREMLLECGVTLEELDILLAKPEIKDIPHVIHKLNNLLMMPESQAIIMEASQAYVDKGLHRINDLMGIEHLAFSVSSILLLIDYHTQFHISVNGKLHRALKLCVEFNPAWFLHFKKCLKWYKREDGIGERDTLRRWNCVKNFCGDNGIPFESPLEVANKAPESDIPEWLRI